MISDGKRNQRDNGTRSADGTLALRHRHRTLSLGQLPWYVLRAPGVAQQLRVSDSTSSPRPRGDRRLTKHHPLCWGSGCPFSPPTSPLPSPPPSAPSGIGLGAGLVGADPAAHLRFLLAGLLLRLTGLGGAVFCKWSRCRMSRRAPSRRVRNWRSASSVSSCSHQAMVVKSVYCFSSAPLRSSSYIAISPSSSLYSSRFSSRVPPSVSM